MTIKEADQAIEEGESLKAIAQAYSEIANLKIKKIRAEVERNRVFFQEIARVYAIVKKFAIKKKINIVKPKTTVSIILTSNHRFYGQINSDLLEFFVIQTQKLNTDKIYLGKAAVDYFKAAGAGSANFKEVLLKEDQPDALELRVLADLIKDYSQVLVFSSQMKSLLVQQPIVLDITATNPELESQPDSQDFKFIFEPDLPKILQFFDSQIITLLLESAFLESELSRTASRFISMDTAENEANKFINQYQTLRAYAKRNLDNNAILENFASMMAVRRGV